MAVETKARKCGRPKGGPKLGGRKKGTPNKMSVLIKQKIERILSLSMRHIERDMRKMDVKDKIQLVSALTRFVLPTAVNLDTISESKVYINWIEKKAYGADHQTN